MISAGDFKNGITIQYENGVWQVIEFQHVKPGKGAAFVRTKLKNVINGGIVEKSFRPTEKFENAIINNKNMQYLYKDGDLYYFMDLKSYEQISIPDNIVMDSLKFIKENDEVKVCSYNGNIFSIEPPISVELRVIKTEPGFKGDTSTNAMKPATLETGVEINVPLFININDIIKVDTRTGEYLSRA